MTDILIFAIVPGSVTKTRLSADTADTLVISAAMSFVIATAPPPVAAPIGTMPFNRPAGCVALPATLRDAGVKENDLEMLARDAMLQQRLLVNNPRDVSYDDALGIYQSAYGAAA